MNKIKRYGFVLLSAVMLLLLSGCRAVLTGDEYIRYYNEDREDVIRQCVGNRVEVSKEAFDLIDPEIYDHSDYKDGRYDITITNNHGDYFYSGTVDFTFGTRTMSVNVHMLAPNCYQYFTVTLSDEEINNAKSSVTGAFYEWKYDLDTFDLGFDFDEIYLDDTGYDERIVVYADKIDEAFLNQMAEFLYLDDTLINYETAATYFLVTYDDYMAEIDQTHILVVDTINQKVTFKDKEGTVIKTTEYNF